MPPCRHPDIQKFDGFRCCLSCGEAVFETDLSIEQGVHKSKDYQYQRLNYKLGLEIRLVVLYPGRELDDLVFDIIYCNLLDKPVYEAVSYTWATVDGDASLSSHASCRGKQIAITKNCDSMLRVLRRQGTNRTIWVDAICIDQENTEERNHQVRLMATIYSNASQVVAYLGPTSEHTNGSIDRVIDHLEGNFSAMLNRTDTRNALDVAAFLRMPYFDRVWVLQEIALASMVTLIVGDRSTRWTADTVSILLALCASLELRPPSVLRWLPGTQPDSDDLLDVLYRSRNCSASDIRDKVYALLGLVKQEISDAISVDYNRTPSDIFIDVAIHLIEEHGRIDVLLHANRDVEHIDAPSWVPLWSRKSFYEPLPPQWSPAQVDTLATAWFTSPSLRSSHLTYEQHQKQRADHASTDFQFKVYDRESGGCVPPLPSLRIRAHFLDTVTHRIRQCMITEHRLPLLPRDLPNAFCGLDPCSECHSKGYVRLESRTSELNIRLMERQYFEGPPNSRPTDLQRIAFMEDMKRFGTRKTTFATHLSLGFGHSPKNDRIKVGDTVWALSGLAVPVVLRKEGQHYILIRECYLFRAAQPFPCVYCGADAEPWPLATEVIDIW